MAAAPSDPSATAPLYLTDSATGELAARRWRVEVIAGKDAGQALVRPAGTVVVGSHPHADLVLTDEAVSRYHLELSLLAEGVLARDLGSTNGTRVGGVRIDSALVPPGGVIKLGHTQLKLSPVDEEVALVGDDGVFGEFITSSPVLKRTLARLRLVARTEATALIEGDTGTGKELLARALHAASPRAAGPFVVVDCGAVNQGVLESMLFGHLKGAFTSAVADRQGAFEAASGGTVFLDELGELPLELQPKLLRVLEARTVRRVGDVVDRPVDVRFVAATNRDLEALVKERRFRDDLFYRVAVVRARVPPLCQRREDITRLAEHLVQRLGKGQTLLSPAAAAALVHYEWPGNVRELRNVLERAVALSPGRTIEPKDLFLEEDAPEEPASFHAAKDQVVAEFERRYVRSLIERHGGNMSSAAREAGLTRTALYALVKRAGITVKER